MREEAGFSFDTIAGPPDNAGILTGRGALAMASRTACGCYAQ